MTTTITARRPQDVTGINPVRARQRVRSLLYRDPLSPADLVAPILVQPDHRPTDEYAHLPSAVAIGQVANHARALFDHGVRACKIFPYVEDKTPTAAAALSEDNPIVLAIAAIRAAIPDMVIKTEVCGCAWTDSGECVLLDDRGRTSLTATYELMGSMALLHATAGADIIGPAALLDGSVHEIRYQLDDAGFADVGLTPSVIFNSVMFDTYKRAMHTDPSRGNRRGFQIDECHQGQAMMQARRWLDEGADSLLVQPALMSVDVLTKLREVTHVPLTTFSVSEEHQLFAVHPDAVLLEYARYLRRAGADLIMTHDALRLARMLEAAQ